MQLQIQHPDGQVQQVPLDQAKNVRVGASDQVEVTLLGSNIAQLHCGFVYQAGKFVVAASKTTKKIQVNGNLVANAAIQGGDKIMIGEYQITVLEPAAAGAASGGLGDLLDEELAVSSADDQPADPLEGADTPMDDAETGGIDLESLGEDFDPLGDALGDLPEGDPFGNAIADLSAAEEPQTQTPQQPQAADPLAGGAAASSDLLTGPAGGATAPSAFVQQQLAAQTATEKPSAKEAKKAAKDAKRKERQEKKSKTKSTKKTKTKKNAAAKSPAPQTPSAAPTAGSDALTGGAAAPSDFVQQQLASQTAAEKPSPKEAKKAAKAAKKKEKPARKKGKGKPAAESPPPAAAPVSSALAPASSLTPSAKAESKPKKKKKTGKDKASAETPETPATGMSAALTPATMPAQAPAEPPAPAEPQADAVEETPVQPSPAPQAVAAPSGPLSPVAMMLIALVIVVLIGGVAAVFVLSAPSETDLFQQADAEYQGGSYGAAIEKFDEYLAEYPQGVDADEARVKRGLARLKPAVEGGSDWNAVLETAREVTEGMGHARHTALAQSELSELLPTIASNLVERAASASGDDRTQAAGEAASALSLVKWLIPPDARARHGIDQVELRLIRLERDLLQPASLKVATESIIQAVNDEQFSQAYDECQRLLDQRPNLERLPALLTTMQKVADAEATRVTFDSQPVAALHGEPESPVQLQAAFVSTTPADLESSGNVVVVQSVENGVAFGLDEASGQVLWQRSIGFDTAVEPLRLGETGIVLVDSVHGEVTRVDAQSGGVVWRQPVGHVAGVRLLADELLVTAAESLFVLSVESGDVIGRYTFGLPLAGAPTVSDDGGTYFVAADHSLLYVVSAEQRQCTGAVYLGHGKGTIRSAPLVGKHLLVVEQHGLRGGRVRTVSLAGMTEGVLVRIDAVPNSAPLVAGDHVFLSMQDGSVHSFVYDSSEQRRPLKQAAKSAPAASDTAVIEHLQQIDGRLWTFGRGVRMFDLPGEDSQISMSAQIHSANTYLQPPTSAGAGQLTVVREAGKSGLSVSAMAADHRTARWTTRLAVPLAGKPHLDAEGKTTTVMNRDGHIFHASLDGRVVSPLASIEIDQPLSSESSILRVDDDGPFVVAPLPGSSLYVLDDLSSADSLRSIPLAGPLACPPLVFGGRLIVAVRGGPIYQLDPTTGDVVGDPYFPELNFESLPNWEKLEVTEGGEFVVVHVSTGAVRLSVNESGVRAAGESTEEEQ